MPALVLAVVVVQAVVRLLMICFQEIATLALELQSMCVKQPSRTAKL